MTIAQPLPSSSNVHSALPPCRHEQPPMKQKRGPRYVMRLYLVRHGESQANLNGTLAGQCDSPLTDTGIAEAKALSRSHSMTSINYWRVYSSDLSRAHDTAKLALRLELDTASSSDGTDDGSRMIMLDQRLRERAYGAREGMPRKLSLDEAISLRRANDIDEPVNPYESEQDILERCIDWLQELVSNAQYANQSHGDGLSAPLHVIAFSHAGFIRGLLLHYIGKDALEQHPDARYADVYRAPKFLIPNTSVNVLDIHLRDTGSMTSDDNFDVELVELNWTEHLDASAGKQSQRGD